MVWQGVHVSHKSYQALTMINLLVRKPEPTQHFPSQSSHLGYNTAKGLGVKEEVHHLPLQTLRRGKVDGRMQNPSWQSWPR